MRPPACEPSDFPKERATPEGADATGWDGSVVFVGDADGRFKLGTPDWAPATTLVANVMPAVPALLNVGSGLEVTFADVGEGDAILLKINETEILVDAGVSSGTDRYLKGVLSTIVGPLEYFVLSHPHIDHYGGARLVLERAAVKHVVTNGERRGDPPDKERSQNWDKFEAAVKSEGLQLEAAKEGTTLVDVDGLKVSVLWSGGHFNKTSSGDSINNDSVVLLVEYAGKRLLLTGDVEVDAGKALVKKYCPASGACPSLDVDILKVPHHGSADFHPAFFAATQPTWAVVSADYHRQDSHRLLRADVLESLEGLGAKVLSTSADGDEPVRLRINPAGEVSWDVPANPAFFWKKADGEWVEVEVGQGQ